MINLYNIKVPVLPGSNWYILLPLKSHVFPSVGKFSLWQQVSMYAKSSDIRYLRVDAEALRLYGNICRQYNLPYYVVRFQPVGELANCVLFTEDQLVFDQIPEKQKFKALIIGEMPNSLKPFILGAPLNAQKMSPEHCGIKVWGTNYSNKALYDVCAPGKTEGYCRPFFEMPQVQDIANPGDLTGNRPAFDIVTLNWNEYSSSTQWDMLEYALTALRPGGIFMLTTSRGDLKNKISPLTTWVENIAPEFNRADRSVYTIVGTKRKQKSRQMSPVDHALLEMWLLERERVDLKLGGPNVQPLELLAPMTYPPTHTLTCTTSKTYDVSNLVEFPTYVLDRQRSGIEDRGLTREELESVLRCKFSSRGAMGALGWEITPRNKEQKDELFALVMANKEAGWTLETVKVSVFLSHKDEDGNDGKRLSAAEVEPLGFGRPRIAWGGVELQIEPDQIRPLLAAVEEKGWAVEVRGAKTVHNRTYSVDELPPLTLGTGDPLLVTGAWDLNFMERFCTEPAFPEDAEVEVRKIVFPVMPSTAHVMKLIDMLDDTVVTGVDGLKKLISGGTVLTRETVQTVNDQGHPVTQDFERFPSKFFIYDLQGEHAGDLVGSTVG